MADFELITNGIEVGFGREGLFAHGLSTTHKFENDVWNHDKPWIHDIPIEWSIRLDDMNPFEAWASSCTNPGMDLFRPRVNMLREYFIRHDERPVGMMRRRNNNEPIILRYHFKNDPSLTAFIMGAIAAGRELSVWGQGWVFLADDVLNWDTSVKGFMERNEPVFVTERPILKII